MSLTDVRPRRADVRRRPATDPLLLAMWAAVAVGAVLIVLTALSQPYNQNELRQMKEYGSSDVGKITGTTRQPPLGPLLGALFQHVLGVGQLQQRLVPVLAGVGTLALFVLLFRQLRLGWSGALGLWLMATAPLMLRYSAYTRPYALPVFLMALLVYAAVRWLAEPRPRWLALALLAAVALPLARVPEPVVYLATTAVVLAVLTKRGRWPWRRSGPLIGICLGALVCVGYPMYRSLASQTGGLYDASPSGVIHRFGSGVHELVTFFLPFLGSLFPWWPLSLLVVVLAVALRPSRRQLAGWWFFWPLLAAPVVFVLAYHFLNAFPFDIRPYRARMAYFFVPPYVLMAASLASNLDRPGLTRGIRVGLSALLAATLLGQLPSTVTTITENQVPDYGQVADVLTHDLPDDAIVLYDTASPLGRWRQPFSARPRYMGDTPFVMTMSRFRARQVPRHGPVFILLLDSRCAYSVVCDQPPAQWRHPLRGWQVRERFDRFALYEPTRRHDGRAGVTRALTELGDALGPEYGFPETYHAARMWRLRGHPERGRALVRTMLDRAPHDLAVRLRAAEH